MNNLTVKSMSKFAMATAAAALFASAIVPSAIAGEEAAGSVKCMGINACKGESKCKTADSACAGQNSCKGTGWILTGSADECTTKGGTVVQ